MTSKDKLIGVSLILIGLGFIALGVVFGMKPKATINNQIYTEQQIVNEQPEEKQTENGGQVIVYEEDGPSNFVEVDEQEEKTTEQEEGSTRYIY